MVATSPFGPDMTFSGNEDEKAVLEKFRSVSAAIIKGYEVEAPAGRFRIGSLELYLYSKGNALPQDEWCDRAKEQLESGVWYFHVKGLKRSRLDISVGSKDVYASLLIQRLMGQRIRTGSGFAFKSLIRGMEAPCNGGWSPEELELFRKSSGASVSSGPIRLVPAPLDIKVDFGPRIFKSPKGREFEKSQLRAFVAEPNQP